jgi:urease alpha subunit
MVTMICKISRSAYADMFGQTARDRVRLADSRKNPEKCQEN